MLLLERDDVASTFNALGDPVRRAIVDQLVHGDATVNELAAQFPISLQAVSKHIKVLEAAGVVSRRKDGQTRPVHFEPACLDHAIDWIESRRRALEARYERLDDVLAELQRAHPEADGPTSRSARKTPTGTNPKRPAHQPRKAPRP